MKRLLIYLTLITLLTACAQEETVSPKSPDGMQFYAVASSLTRATGIYEGTTYPVSTSLYLTAYHVDKHDQQQYYFEDKILDYDELSGVWTATNWFWPIQGKMSFLSYWCPGFSRAPSFDEIEDIDGNKMARMSVDATDLDGLTDFIFLSQHNVDCPQTSPTTLTYTHGLSWITLSVKAEVYKEGGTNIDTLKTNELASHIRVHKVVVEDCARKGRAVVVPGSGINWKTYDEDTGTSYVRDQIYYKNNDAAGAGTSDHTWEECTDALDMEITSYLTIALASQPLGVYPAGTSYIGKGLLIVPQNKTSITVDYTVADADGMGTNLHKVERFVLRDNTIAWKPGYHYNYDIVFRNYGDIDHNFEVIETWSGVYLNDGNLCYDNGAFGNMDSENNVGDSQVIIEPIHGGGSGAGDDMDYPEGPQIF